MQLSFHEKSLWLVFVSLVVVFGGYFAATLPSPASDVQPQHVVFFVAAVVVLVITQIAGHILIAIVDRRDETDERDRLIALKGTRNGAWLLATGVFLALCAGVFVPGNFVFTQLLLAFWVAAQLMETGSQLYFHRRGV